MMIRNATCAIAAITLLAGSSLARAQAPNLGGQAGAAASQRAQAQAQQRVQAQVQQRVQAQAQQRAAASAQSRVQVEAARAAQIAQQAAAMAQRQAEAARAQAAGGARVRAGVGVSANNQAQVGNANARARANARLGIDASLVVPPGITHADVQIYDRIFGPFNPLRRQQPAAGGEAQQTATAQASPQPAGNGNGLQRRSADGALITARNELDLHSRLVMAMHQRRAQISELRDRALETGNTQLLLQAERMEEAMNAFLAARAATEAEVRAAANQPTVTPLPPTPPFQLQGQGTVNTDASGAINPATANAEGTGTVSGDGSVPR